MIDQENLGKSNKIFFSEFEEYFKRFLESGWYILGKNVTEFEEAFAKWCDTPYCIGVASGLDAITLALRALNLEPGSEVIVPSNTYIATILSVLQNNLTPVLVEPDISTYNIDPDKIQEKITGKTKVILPVHLYGKISRMDKIVAIAQNNGLFVVEDCAQAHGSSLNNKKAGTFGDFGAFSFYPTKNLGALGDAGAITTNKKEYSEYVKILRNYGSNKKYYNEVVGYNSRLDELQAGLLNIKLKHLTEINEHKRSLAKLYDAGLSDRFIKPTHEPATYDTYHQYVIRHPKRDALKTYLLENDIKTEIHYPVPPHKQVAMRGVLTGNYPISEEIHATILSLPIAYYHTETDIKHVIEVMNRFD